jgi:hypothetical protein
VPCFNNAACGFSKFSPRTQRIGSGCNPQSSNHFGTNRSWRRGCGEALLLVLLGFVISARNTSLSTLAQANKSSKQSFARSRRLSRGIGAVRPRCWDECTLRGESAASHGLECGGHPASPAPASSSCSRLAAGRPAIIFQPQACGPRLRHVAMNPASAWQGFQDGCRTSMD